MKIKLSATFLGKCNICKEEKIVFTAGDEDSKKVVTVCEDCAKKLGSMEVSEVIEKYGHKDEEVFRKGIRIIHSSGKDS